MDLRHRVISDLIWSALMCSHTGRAQMFCTLLWWIEPLPNVLIFQWLHQDLTGEKIHSINLLFFQLAGMKSNMLVKCHQFIFVHWGAAKDTQMYSYVKIKTLYKPLILRKHWNFAMWMWFVSLMWDTSKMPHLYGNTHVEWSACSTHLTLSIFPWAPAKTSNSSSTSGSNTAGKTQTDGSASTDVRDRNWGKVCKGLDRQKAGAWSDGSMDWRIEE